MSHPCLSTSGVGAARGGSDGKNAAVGEIAPSATVTWGEPNRIFATTETTNAQLARVREKICAYLRPRVLQYGPCTQERRISCLVRGCDCRSDNVRPDQGTEQ